MRIGIDARFLTHPQVGGFKTYSQNLVEALSRIDQNNSYVIYLDRPQQEGHLPQSENFIYRVINGSFPGIGVPVREQLLLRRSISRDKLDIVHFLCNTAPARISEKFIITLHDTIQLTTPSRFKILQPLSAHKKWAMSAYSKWSILKTVESSERVITVSHYEKAQIEEQLGIKPETICVTHLAPNREFAPINKDAKKELRQEIKERFGLGRKYIFGIGYETRKNIPLLINAFALIAPNNPSLDLVIVAAEENCRNYFRQMAADMNLSDRIAILASLPPKDLAKLYNLAEIFVYPSQRESFGLPPLEAIACGTPTIVMNMTSMPEILQDGVLYVDGKDPKNWAHAIETVFTDDDLRSELRRVGLARAGTLTWEKCAQETLNIYYSVIEKS